MSDKTSEKSEQINITVSNLDGVVTYFCFQRKTKLKKMMDMYCERLRIPRTDVVFLHASSVVNDDDTIESLDMQEGDIIEVFPSYKRMDCLEKICKTESSKSKLINIKVKRMYGGVFNVKVKRETKLKTVMAITCDRFRVPRLAVVFVHARSGIKEEDTVTDDECRLSFPQPSSAVQMILCSPTGYLPLAFGIVAG